MNSNEFKKLVLPHGKKLFHFARLLLKDDHEAQDAVQEVFVKLWKKRIELNKVKNIEAFCMRIIKNWCLDKLKAKKHVLVENYSYDHDKPDNDKEPHKILETGDKISNVYAILDKLPEQQKIAVKLRDIDGYDFLEIAEITGLSETTIRVNLSRARKKIREELLKIEHYGIGQD